MNSRPSRARGGGVRFLLLFAGIVLVLSVMAVGSAAGANHCSVTVASGDSVQNAIDSSGPGDTVCLEDGNFSEAVTVGVDNLTIAAADGASPVLEGGGVATAIQVDGAQNVTIQNVTIEGYTDESVLVTGTSDNLTISSVDMTGSEWGVFVDDGAARDVTIENSQFSDHLLEPIYIGEFTDRTQIRDNVIDAGAADHGIYVQSPEAIVANNTVENGNIRVMDRDSVVRDNEVTAADIGIDASIDADSIEIVNNTVADVNTGISATVATPVIRNNTISNATVGLELDGASTATVRDNALDTGLILDGEPTNPAHYDHDIANNTLANGSLVYINGEVSPTIPEDAGQIFVVDSSNVTISGFDLSSVASGIFVAGSPSTNITNNSIADTGGSGIRLWSSDSVRIADNDLQTNGYLGTSDPSVQVVNSQNAILERNSVTDAKRQAIQVENSPDSLLTGNVLSDNFQGIQVSSADRTVLSNNTVTGSHHGGSVNNQDGAVHLFDSTSLLVMANNVSDNAGSGFYDNGFSGIPNATFTDNTVSGNGESGFNWATGDGATFENNTIESNGGIGIEASNAATVRNNSIVDNYVGINVHREGVIEDNFVQGHDSTGIISNRNVTIRSNTIEDNARGLQIGILTQVIGTNLIENNTARGNSVDLVIDKAPQLTIRNNSFETGMRMEAGVTPEVGELTTHTFVNNTVAGDPLIHVHDQSNVTVTGPAGQVIVTNSTNVTLENLSLSQSAAAVQVAFSNQTKIAGVSISDSTGEFPNRGAITMWRSHDSTIRDSVLTDNQLLGIELIGSPNTTILDNRIEGTGDMGISVDQENAGIVAHGNILSGNGEGISNLGNVVINATHNWWGDQSGPSGGVTDPNNGTTASGSGDSVSSTVLFDPWLESEPQVTEPAFFEVSNVSASDTVLAGETLEVNATVTNTGDIEATQEITLEDLGGSPVATNSISLAGGNSTSVTLSWLTADGDVGSGDVTVSSDDDSATTPVSVVPNGTIDVDSCQTISLPGTYQLTDNISIVGTCFTVTSSDVRIDGNGHTIETGEPGSTVYAVYADGSAEPLTNVTVTNATIRNSDVAIRYDDADDGEISDIHVADSGDAVLLQGADNNTVSNLTVHNVSYRAVQVGWITQSHNNVIANVTATETGTDLSTFSPGTFYMDGGTGNEFRDIAASGGRAGVVAASGGNAFENVVATDNDLYGLVVESGFENTFENVTVERNGWEGIILDESHGSTFSNVTSRDNEGTGIFFSGDYQSNAGSTGNTFTGVTATGNNGNGVGISLSDNNDLSDLYLANNSDSQLEVTSRSIGNTISNVTVRDSPGTAIGVQSNDNAQTVIDGVDVANSEGGLSLHGEDTTVTNVSLAEINSTALTVSSGAGGELGSGISNVSIDSVTGDGAAIYGESYHQLRGVDIANVSGTGIRVTGGNNTITDSAVSNASTGLTLQNTRQSTFENVSLDGSRVSLGGQFVTVSATAEPATPPANYSGIGHYLDVQTTASDGELSQLTTYYEAADVSSIDEASLRIWRHTNGTWNSPANGSHSSGYDLAGQSVFALGIEDSGVYGPLGQADPVLPPSGTLEGTTVSGGDPVPNATVIIEEISTGYADYTDTPGSGTFQFDAPVGTYNVSATADGYLETVETNVSVSENATTNRTINMSPLPDPGILSGTFVDAETGEPINGYWTVTAIDEESGEEFSESLSSMSTYEMELPVGTYTLEVEFMGAETSGPYASKTIGGLEIRENQTTEQIVELEPIEYAQFSYDPTEPTAGQEVTFDASNSTLPFGTIEEYLWDVGATGDIDYNSTSPLMNHTFQSAGEHDVTLIVFGGGETAEQVTRTISVKNPAPPPTPPSSDWSSDDDRDRDDGILELEGRERPDGSIGIDAADIDAGTDVRITPRGPADQPEWPIEITSINFTTTEDTDLSMELYIDDGPPTPDARPFERDDGTQIMLYHQLLHGIADEAVADVEIEFIVDTDALDADEDPGDIALYRLVPGEGWTELETTYVTESDGEYVYRATSPGLSQFATGIKQAQFVIRDAMVSVSELQTGDSTEITVQIDNTGGAAGTFTAELWINDELSEERDLTIADGGTRQTTFERTFEEPGTYEVIVNDFSSGEVEVAPGDAAAGGDGGLPMVAIGIVAVLAIAGAAAYVLYARSDE